MDCRRMVLAMLIFFSILLPIKVFAADYAVAAPIYSLLDNTCSVAIWIHNRNESKEIIYRGSYNKTLCHVEIPAKQFEKHFIYCTLAGIAVNGSDSYLAQFGGGAGGGREIYWFEWRDANKVFPTFNCVLKQ